jgi:hypothetical protein
LRSGGSLKATGVIWTAVMRWVDTEITLPSG